MSIYEFNYTHFSTLHKYPLNSLMGLVGLPGFEPGTSCTPN